MQHSQPQSVIQQQQQAQQQAQATTTNQQQQQASQQQSQQQQQQASQQQHVGQPQVITLQQLSNFFPQQGNSAPQIHHLNAADAAQLQQQVQAFQQAQAAAAAGSPQQQNVSQQNLKTLYASPTGQQQQVFNIPQQFIQIKNDSMPQQQIIQLKQPDGSVTQQIIQLKPNDQIPQQQHMQQVIQGGQIIQGPNGMFQIVQPMQTVTVDGQEALFIPQQQQMQQAFITPSGQIVRGPMMSAPGNFLHNMPQTVQLPNGKFSKQFLNFY